MGEHARAPLRRRIPRGRARLPRSLCSIVGGRLLQFRVRYAPADVSSNNSWCASACGIV